MSIDKKNSDDYAINGGNVLFDKVKTTMNLPAPSFENFSANVARYMNGSNDPVVDLENALSEFHQVPYVVCFSSCFTAMALTLRLLAIKGKTEVILPALTYRRMSDIVLWAGLIPCFCDNSLDTLGVSPKTIEPLINENTAVILAPHPLVNFSDISGIEALAKEKGIPLMFDSVEAIAGSHGSIPVGSFGMAESFSLHPSKLMNACEGGYITTKNKDIYEYLLKMRDGNAVYIDGEARYGHFSRMNKYHAIMGISSLDIVADTIKENFEYYQIYRNRLNSIKGIRLVEYDETEKRNYKSILIEVTSDYSVDRDKLHDILNAEYIYARKFYYPAQSSTQLIKSTHCQKKYDVAEYLQERYLLLPFGHSTSTQDINDICDLIEDVNTAFNSREKR